MKKTTKRILSVMLALVICVSVMPFAFAASVRGDANFDGKTNSTDALLILKYSVGQEVEDYDDYLFDVNGDYTVNSTDALRVLMISVGNDDPLTYNKKEILKFYSDALITACKETTKIEYNSVYDSILVNDDNESEYIEFNSPWDMEAYFENGYDEYGDSSLDYCPYPWIEEEATTDVKIKKIDGGYTVEIKLIEETADYEEPWPYYNYIYTADYADCTISGLEDYYVADATSYFEGSTIVATITDDGYLEKLYIEIPFELYMYMESYEGYYYLNATETGMITDTYTFTF